METILIATDFSEASRNASFYGVKLAKLLGAKVVLLNVYSFVAPTADTETTAINKVLRQDSRDGLRSEVGRLDPIGTVEIEKRGVQGDPSKVILSEARKVKATWIIAGM